MSHADILTAAKLTATGRLPVLRELMALGCYGRRYRLNAPALIGLTLVLEGRFRAWPNGRVIRCWGSGVSHPPSCVASVHLDRAAIERPENNGMLAEWRN